MPQKNIPPDWYLAFFGIFWTALAGVLGALVRQITGPKIAFTQRLSEWIVGAIFSVYATPVAAPIMIKYLSSMGLLDNSSGLTSENVAGLSGFLCGIVSISILDWLIGLVRKKFGKAK